MDREFLTLDDLLEDARFDEAASFLDAVAREDPTATWALALRAICLEQAEPETGAGLALARTTARANPEDESARWAAGAILLDRDRYSEALAHAIAATELGPHEPRNWSLLAGVRAHQQKWAECLEAADRGLALDPQGESCAAYRSLALRSSEFDEDWSEELDMLATAFPASSWARSGRGWALLEVGHATEAKEEFEQALALDPTSDWAAQGMLRAVKAQNPIYSAILQFFLWLDRLPTRTRWTYIIGGWLVFRLSQRITSARPELAPLTYPIIAAWVFFIIASWTSEPISNFILLRSEAGRKLVRGTDRLAANLIGGLMGVALITTLAGMVSGAERAIAAALGSAFLIIPVSAVFKCNPGWPRKVMTVYAGFVATVFVTTVAAPVQVMRDGNLVVILMSVVGSWLGAFLATRVPGR